LAAPPRGWTNWSVMMLFTARCWMRPPAALAAATIFLTACAAGNSDTLRRACPPLVEYGRAEQARVAEEVDALSEGAVIAEWLADYAVLRAQARACQTP
ncbi:MAG: hypothetical protein ACK4MX_13410, partial [Thermaurantiacus sp.]